MARQAVLINTGFDPTAALEVISALSLSSGDMVVSVYPASEDGTAQLRGEQARAQVRSFLKSLEAGGRSIGYREVRVDLADIPSALSSLLTLLRELNRQGYEVLLELTGGVRTLTLLMTLLSVWFSGLVKGLTMIVETTRQRIYVPSLSPLQLNSGLQRRVLREVVRRGSVRRKQLAELLDISESSVSKAVSSLKKMGLLQEALRVLSLGEDFKPLASLLAEL